MKPGYHGSRFGDDPRREVLWRTLCDAYFRHRVPTDGTVLELGAGYGHFINNIPARRRIALDAWPGIAERVAAGVEAIVGDAADLSAIADGTVDYAFASNLFEHLPQSRFAAVLDALRSKLSPRGRLAILQPNYRYAYREYFDDYTHVAVYSHVSLADFLTAHGFRVIEVLPRFLPLSIKGRLPVTPMLIRAYLRSPVKPLGKQMLVTAGPAR